MSRIVHDEMASSTLRVKAKNDEEKRWFFDILDHRRSDVKEFVQTLSMYQWCDETYNIIDSAYQCWNGCRYCYIMAMNRRFRRGTIIDQTFHLHGTKVKKGWRKGDSKLFMFPSSHDIFEDMVDSYIEVARKMIDAGHRVLCVTKPRLSCIDRITRTLMDVKDKILYRFTIGSVDNEVLSFWEPHAPSFEERLDALKLAFERGFETSVSMEPLLEDPARVIERVTPYVTESIWLGYMNYQKGSAEIHRLCQCKIEGVIDIEDTVDDLETLEKRTHDLEVLKTRARELVDRYRDNPKIYFKEGMMTMLVK